MADNKRAKELARAKHHRRAARRHQTRQQRRRQALVAAGIVFALIVLGGIAFAAWPESSPTAAPASSPSATQSAPPAPVPTPTDVSCSEATPASQTKTYPQPSAQGLKNGAAMTLDTNCGPIVIALDVAAAPKTSNAIAFLANSGWYNGNACHRVTTQGIYVVQCGSPSLDGKGGPGFKLPEENLPTSSASGTATYPAGTVAMANAGKGTGGSQFFLVYKDTQLGPNYTIFGQVSSGLNIVEYVAAKGVSSASTSGLADGPPNQPLIIKTATVRNG